MNFRFEQLEKVWLIKKLASLLPSDSIKLVTTKAIDQTIGLSQSILLEFKALIRDLKFKF